MTEAAFAGAGRKAGMELWRIENLAVVKQPKVGPRKATATFLTVLTVLTPLQITGQFHSGDSYILLTTVASKSGSLSWAIHFWLGSETSHDEAGIAAYKSVELDESLGGGPVQYREVQGKGPLLAPVLLLCSGGDRRCGDGGLLLSPVLPAAPALQPNPFLHPAQSLCHLIHPIAPISLPCAITSPRSPRARRQRVLSVPVLLQSQRRRRVPSRRSQQRV